MLSGSGCYQPVKPHRRNAWGQYHETRQSTLGIHHTSHPALLITASPARQPRRPEPTKPRPPTSRTIKLGEAHPGTLYAMTVAVKDPAKLQGSDAILATVKDSQGVIDSKWLHTADLDLYLTLRPRAAGPITVTLSAPPAPYPKSPPPCTRSSTTPPLPAHTGVIAAAPNRHLANRPTLPIRPNHLRQRRRAPLRPFEQ